MPNALDWTAAESAIYDWIKAALGDIEVRWSGQDVAQIEADFATIAITSIVPLGSPSERIVYDPARDATGEGVELQSGGPAEVVLTLSVFTAEAVGLTGALTRLARARSLLQNQETNERAALRDAGVTVSRFAGIGGVPALVGADIQGRASLELRLYVQDYASIFTTWIERATWSGALTS